METTRIGYMGFRVEDWGYIGTMEKKLKRL